MRRAASPSAGCARKKTALAASFRSEFAAEIEALTEGAVDAWDLEAIETAALRKAKQFTARIVERRFNSDTTDHAGPSRPCPCGKTARYAGRRLKTFESALGPLTLSRAYFHCEACETGVVPRDGKLGLAGGSLTPAVRRMVGHVGAQDSFQEGHELLRDLAGVQVSPKHVERAAEALGREIAADEKAVVEGPAANEPLPETLYLGLDGSGIPMRAAELEGRAGKQPDGKSKTREVKLVTIWSAEKCDEEGIPVRDEGSQTYSAAIESAAQKDTDPALSPFAQRVQREATRRGFERAKRRAVVADCAPWIWNTIAGLFPDAIQIADRYHVNEHLSDAAKAIYGPESDLGKKWAHDRCTELKAGKLDAVLAALATHSVVPKVSECIGYIENNRHRMRYAEFHAAGLCTSSGVVESGCKRVIGVRLKRGGMFWTVAGADAIIALRACRLSGRFEEFWERRALKATG